VTQRYILLGNIGNIITIIASIYLLYLSANLQDWIPKCVYESMPNSLLQSCVFREGGQPSGEILEAPTFLDPCYVCDGFCTALRVSSQFNSHMLSLYADFLMTVPLLLLVARRGEELEKFGLDKWFLSNLKMLTVAGHGVAHLALGVLENEMQLPPLGLLIGRLILCVLLGYVVAPFFLNEGLFLRMETLFGITKADDPKAPEISQKHFRSLRKTIPIVLSQIPYVLIPKIPQNLAGMPIQKLIFGGTGLLFFWAGTPIPDNRFIFGKSLLSSVLLMSLSEKVIGGGEVETADKLGLGFAFIFTSAYVHSAVHQLFFWGGKDAIEKKEGKYRTPKIYALNTWCTSVLTTVVGWALALQCTPLKNFGGHVLYDLSIPLSYFMLYYLVKKFVKLDDKK